MRIVLLLVVVIFLSGCGQKGCPEGKRNYKGHCIPMGALFSEPEEGVIIFK